MSMPKAHRLANQATHFAISPWQCKRKHAEDGSKRGDYSEVVVALPSSKAPKDIGKCIGGPAADHLSAECGTAQLPGWRSKRQTREEAEQPQQEEQEDAFNVQHLVALDTSAHAALLEPNHLQGQTAISGVGYVAVLPDGQCIGESCTPLHPRMLRAKHHVAHLI